MAGGKRAAQPVFAMIGALENQMLDRLKAGASSGRLGYAWKTCESYPADWDGFFKEKRQINPPGVWIGFAGTQKISLLGSGMMQIDAVFGLTVIASNLRNEQARRHGVPGAGEVGSYQLIIDALSLLINWRPASGTRAITAGRLRHVRPGEVLTEMKASMMAVELFASFEAPTLPAQLDAPDLADFERFHANWDVQPFGGIDASAQAGVQLPDDGHADATDHVELAH